uniref:hypothetical protein n=1 Tax=Alistipes sp. D31t1_170403_E11 TaxID=2787128 RepID=UPI001E2E66F5|nr:hypothetical protein [Alistipes sp. D31t1_170403_E11]
MVRSRTPGYVFQCHACNEDFYRFEVLNTRQIPLVRELRCMERERKLNPDDEVRSIIISRSLLVDHGYNPDLPNKEEMKIIARELLEYWGVSGGFKDALASTMQSMFGNDSKRE